MFSRYENKNIIHYVPGIAEQIKNVQKLGEMYLTLITIKISCDKGTFETVGKAFVAYLRLSVDVNLLARTAERYRFWFIIREAIMRPWVPRSFPFLWG